MGGRDHSYDCGTCGMERGGLNDVPCDCDTTTDSGLIWLNFEIAMGRLAHNLAIGAALCEAHEIALNEAEGHRLYHEHGYRSVECWRPGCGKAAP